MYKKIKYEHWQQAPKKIQALVQYKTRSKISKSEARHIIYLIADSINMSASMMFEAITNKR